MGRLGKFQLASVVLGESVFNVTGFSLVIGLCSGMDTLAPQVCFSSHLRIRCMHAM